MNIKNKSEQKFKICLLKERQNSSTPYHLFIKLHNVKKQEPEYPRGQTLFMLNIPPTVTNEVFKEMITQQFPSVSLVNFVSQPDTHTSTFKNAYVVFEEESDVKKLLALPEGHVFTAYTESSPGLFGLSKWIKEYNKTLKTENAIKNEIKSHISNYDKKVKEKNLEIANAEKANEDGWVTVTGKKKRGKFATARKESVMKRLKEKHEMKKKKELVNIYPHQIREAKKERLVELRKKFELDKMKLEQYKQKRKFKPL